MVSKQNSKNMHDAGRAYALPLAALPAYIACVCCKQKTSCINCIGHGPGGLLSSKNMVGEFRRFQYKSWLCYALEMELSRFERNIHG
jgi:hypothetical protein